MKKTTLLWGALLAAFALQACNNTEDSTKMDPAASETPSDTNLAGDTQWKTPDGRNVVASGEIALGGDGQIMVQSAYTNPGGGWTGNGVGITDATLCGDGRDACTAACPEPCLAPGYPYACGPCASRGTWAAGVITANLTLNNITAGGTYGACSLQDKSVCSTTSLDECLPGNMVTDPDGTWCNGNPVTSGGTLADTNPENTIPAGIMAGFCQDGVTACDAPDSNGGGSSVDCGGLGTCSDSAAQCGPGADLIINNLVGSDDDVSACGNPLTATCVQTNPLIGDGRCWSGCGTCTPGRDFNCAAFTYTMSNTNGGAGDLKCTGGPYSMANAEIGGDTIVVGTVPSGGSAPFTFQLNSSDSSFCVHAFVVSDDPYGDEAGQGCTATCGDGVVATANGELCEPTNDPADTLPPYTHLGCLVDGEECTLCNSCAIPSPTCGNGLPDAGEGCDDGALNGTTTCGCQANCQFAPASVSCRASAGSCDVAETCDGAGACPADTVVAAGTTCRASVDGVSVAPPEACDPEEQCDGLVGTCPADVVTPNGNACDDGAAPAGDTCNAGVCQPAGQVCGDLAVTGTEQCDPPGPCCTAGCMFEPNTTLCRAGSGDSCDPDENCDGAGACDADVVTGAGTLCRAGSGDLCDPDETCTGVAGAACPADVVTGAGTECRADADGTDCDAAEQCTGVAGAACPADICETVGTGCTAGGTCDGSCVCTVGLTITSVTPIKGVSADAYPNDATQASDYNSGMVTGSGAVEWYTIMPNDPDVTSPAGGTDMIWATVNFSAALGGGDTVTCTVNGNAMNESDCGAGDTSCRVFGAHPELTAVVADGQTNGAVTGTFPDEGDTALAVSVDCVLNANPAVSAAGDLALGFLGVQDATLAAAGGTLNAQILVYCSNGATEDCNDFILSGDSTTGVRANSLTLHYNSSIFTGVSGSTAPPVRVNPAVAYGGPSTVGACSGVTLTATCTQLAAGLASFSGPVVNSACEGWMMAHLGTCNLSYSAQPAGTYATIDTTALSGDLVFYIAGGAGLPIRGLAGDFATPLPSTNVSGQFMYQ